MQATADITLAAAAVYPSDPFYDSFGSISLLGNLTSTEGSVTLSAGGGGVIVIGPISTQTGLAVNSTGSAYLQGVISGAGGFTQNISGVARLGADTYIGGTTISAGTLQIAVGFIVGDVTDNGVLEFSRSDATSFNGALSGSGAVRVDGGGVLTLSGYSGGTAVTGGSTVAITADAGLGAATGGLTLDGGTLRATQSFISTRGVTLGGGGGVTVGNTKTLDLGGVIAGAPGALQGR